MTNPRFRSLFPVALICASAVVFAACGDGGSDSSSGAEGGDAPAVVATTSIWADVISEVACGEVDVTSLIPLGIGYVKSKAA